jgi:chromosome partitioning protein
MLSRSLAVQSLIEGKRSAILDVDPQATSMLWAKRREAKAPTVVEPESRPIEEALKRLENAGAEIVFIDTPPSVHPVVNIAINAADSSVILCEPLPEAIEQVGAMASIVSKVGRPSSIIINRVLPRTSAFGMAKVVLTAFQIPVCPTALTQLMTHPYAASDGQTAQEREPSGKAAVEIKAAYDWLAGREIL